MRNPPHVLIAEDECVVALVLAYVLEGEGFRVTVTHNGLEAVEADAADPADILLTDMHMPEMGGEALIRIIRLRRPDLPIIIISGFSDLLPSPEPGRLEVLHKPYEMSVVLRMIAALLSG